jgi:DNA invertase Pin-like site-specific DNA recombinase
MKLVGYGRVSQLRGRQGETFISLDLQRDACEAYARAHGHEIVAWHADTDQPGSKLDRPELAAALDAIAAADASGLIAARLDRITRNVGHLGKLLEQAHTDNWNLIACDVGLDLATPTGKLVARVLGSIAEWELDRRREGWAEARAHAVERGVHIASRAPTGYRRKDDGRLEPEPRAAKAIAECFRRRASGASWRELADLLESRGVVGPYGSANWTTGAVKKMITNRVYLGEARHGEFHNKDAHKPIVSEADFAAAQAARSASTPRSADGALLSGLLRCGSCGFVLKPDSMIDANGNKLRLYRCRGRHASGRCPKPTSVLGRVAEPWVQERFLDALGPGGVLARSVEDERELADADAAHQAAETELAAWHDVGVATLGKDAYVDGLRKRQQAASDARARHQALLAAAAGPLGQHTASVEALWPDLSTPEKRPLLAAAIDAVVLWPQARGEQEPIDRRTRILWAGQADGLDLPRRGRRVPLRGIERDRPLASVTPLQQRDERQTNRAPRRRRHT